MNFIRLLDDIVNYDINLYREIKLESIFKPKDTDELNKVVRLYCDNKEKGIYNYCIISLWDVSNVTNMSGMFSNSKFDGDISSWDVSNVTSMSYMFHYSKFNGDISLWDVSNVTNMGYIFSDSEFNYDISDWDVSNVINMDGMFYNSDFNGDISPWDVSNVRNMRYMFYNSYFDTNSKFNGNISSWDVSNVIYNFNIFNLCGIKEEYKPKFSIGVIGFRD